MLTDKYRLKAHRGALLRQHLVDFLGPVGGIRLLLVLATLMLALFLGLEARSSGTFGSWANSPAAVLPLSLLLGGICSWAYVQMYRGNHRGLYYYFSASTHAAILSHALLSLAFLGWENSPPWGRAVPLSLLAATTVLCSVLSVVERALGHGVFVRYGHFEDVGSESSGPPR